jgi:hypothetical protein
MTREIPSQSRETLEVPLIPLASTSLVVWRCLMRPSRFIHRHLLCLYGFGLGGAAIDHMLRQNRLRPLPRSRQKISRHATGEEDGASFNLASPARGLAQRARRQLVPPEVRIFVQHSRQVSVALRLL